MTIDTNAELGVLVLENPGFVPILERHRLDFCCQGRQSLVEACRTKGVDLDLVVSQLENAEVEIPERDWQSTSLAELIDHIQTRYHEPLRQGLPGLEEKARRVAQVHGQGQPALLEVKALVSTLSAELLSHTRKEDVVLFPWIRELESGQRKGANLDAPVQVMEAEHDDAGALLACLRTATDDYRLPAEACTTYRLLFSGLEQLERDLHRHIHLENAVLFPRALAMARG